MTTALITYGTQVAATSLTSAGKLATTTGGAGGTTTTAIGTATGYGELCALGTASAWPSLGSIPAPTGKGWLLDSTLLNSQALLAGNWTPTFKSKISAGTLTADVYIRAFAYDTSALTYTAIGICELAAQGWSTTAANYNFLATLIAEFIFNGTQRLYIDCWPNVTANSSSAGSFFTVNLASTGATGVVGDMQMTTPGYNPTVQPTGTLSGVGTLSAMLSASATLSGECDGIGMLSATMSAATSLSSTLSGVGTLSATGAYQAALSGTIAGVGTLIVTPSFTVAFSGTLQGIGTLSGTLTAQAALLATLAGVGTLGGTLTCITFLSATLPGVGTFALVSVFTPVYRSVTWVTQSGNVTWVTQEGDVTWSML